MEGSGSVLELSAIALHCETRQIVDVFHAYAQPKGRQDWWPRTHVHGLNDNFLRMHGYPCDTDLVEAFKSWLSFKTVINMFANDPTYERKVLNLDNIQNLSLPIWIEREGQAFHELKIWYKQNNLPIFNVSCCPEAHRDYIPRMPESESQKARERHGYHCALYDAFELMLYYMEC